MMDGRYRYTEATVRFYERKADSWRNVAMLAVAAEVATIVFFAAMIWSGCP